jgi:hypothetical protein
MDSARSAAYSEGGSGHKVPVASNAHTLKVCLDAGDCDASSDDVDISLLRATAAIRTRCAAIL